MPKRDQAKTVRGARNDSRKNGKASKKHPGRPHNRCRMTPEFNLINHGRATLPNRIGYRNSNEPRFLHNMSHEAMAELFKVLISPERRLTAAEKKLAEYLMEAH